MSSETTPPKICQVCKRALARIEAKDGAESWDHFPQDSLSGHKAVPVDPAGGKLRGRCDFCNADLQEELWILPVADFLAGHNPETGRMQAYEGNWSACSECAPLIDGNRWSALVRRVGQVWEEQHGIPVPPNKVTGWGHLYRLVRKNIRGAIYRAE
ncbi:hypothetical protein [Streptomyces sp. NPDC058252]|uniref:hypothetical protein n=1 Tax=Streptomyces sp. NPDC058252 TaxID=3346405 RepID=UPI0036E2F8EB